MITKASVIATFMGQLGTTTQGKALLASLDGTQRIQLEYVVGQAAASVAQTTMLDEEEQDEAAGEVSIDAALVDHTIISRQLAQLAYADHVRMERVAAPKHTHIPGEIFDPRQCPGCQARR